MKKPVRITEYKKHPLRQMLELGQELESMEDMSDNEFFEDRVRWVKDNTKKEDYKSSKKSDKKKITDMDITTLCVLIQQVLRFGRMILTNDKGEVYNLPEGEIPKFYVDVYNPEYNQLKKNLRRDKNV